jgi:hypothetical protein
MLELSGAWEPPGNSADSPFGESLEASLCVSY